MNRNEIMQLSPEQLKFEIAKVKEITFTSTSGNVYPFDSPDIPRRWAMNNISNWPTSIADAWELECEITVSHWTRYVEILKEVVEHDKHAVYTTDFDDEARMEIHPYCLIHATPLQRSRAYLIWKLGAE